MTTIQLRPAGPLCYELRGGENLGELIGPLWRQAEQFVVVCIMPARIDKTTGAKKLRAARAVLSSAADLLSVAWAARWLEEWPGTQTSMDSALGIFGRARSDVFQTLFPTGCSPWWSGPGGWEDLHLISEGKLHFYCCTHERFGAAFGVAGELPGTASPLSDQSGLYRIQGVDADLGLLRGLAGCP